MKRLTAGAGLPLFSTQQSPPAGHRAQQNGLDEFDLAAAREGNAKRRLPKVTKSGVAAKKADDKR